MTDVDTQEIRPTRGPGNSPWRNELLCKRVHALWSTHSATQIAEKIWLEFQVEISRDSVVGYLHRQKLTVEHKAEVHPLTRENGTRRPRIQPATPVNVRQINAAKAAPRFKPEPFVCAPVFDLGPLNISLDELTETTCRYPSAEAPFTFCGLPNDGSSYCAKHHRICSDGIPVRRVRAPHPAEFGKSKGGVFGRVA